MNAMQQTGDDEEQKDGIDMALGVVDIETNQFNYAELLIRFIL